MNKKGSFFLATFTVLAFFVFVVFVNMNKEKFLSENRITDVGKFPEISINATLDEEEIEFFLEKAMEYSSFNVLLRLGEEGGTLKDQNCEEINGYVIWRDDCFFSDKLEENFFERFKLLFDGYVKEYGLNSVDTEWKIDENGELVIEPNNLIEVQYEEMRYGFEPDTKYILNYNFDDYSEILRKAKECIRDEELKGTGRNNLFEDCRDDKDFKWAIKVDGAHIVFDVMKRYKNLGDVTIKFALPYDYVS